MTMSENYPPVEPHGPIEAVFENVFRVQGTVVMAPLVRLTRNMVVLRHDGELALVNAVRLNSEGEAALEALGKVAHIIRIGFHGMDDGYYQDRYQAKLWALPGVETRNGAKTTDELAAGALPFPTLSLFQFEHTLQPEAALVFDGDGGVLLTCDSVQNWVDTKGCSVVAKGVTRVMGFVNPAQIGPPWRKMMTPEGGSLQPDFERLVALPFKHLIGGHGVPLKDHAPERLRETIARVYGG